MRVPSECHEGAVKVPWDARLVASMDRLHGHPFVWGRTDCLQVAFHALDALLGAAHHVPQWQNAWTTAREAVRRAKSQDPRLIPYLEQAGASPVHVGFQQRGDLLLAPVGQSVLPRVHVCLGGRAVSAAPHLGVFFSDSAPLLALPGLVIYRPERG